MCLLCWGILPAFILLYFVVVGGSAVGETFRINVLHEDTQDPRNGQFPLRPSVSRLIVTLHEPHGCIPHMQSVLAPFPGPNSEDCQRGNQEDAVRFDGAFTCNCGETRYSGDNCETEVDSAVDQNVDTGPIVGLVFGILLLGAAAAIAVLRRRAYLKSITPTDFEARVQALLDNGELVPDQISANRTPREIRRPWLTLVEKVGSGNFGEVWKGTLDDKDHPAVPEYMVAAKTVLDTANQEATDDLLQEATVMHTLGSHEHVVSLIGVITTGDPYVIIIGFCEYGSLASVLAKKAANGNPVEVEAKLRMCRETALGMNHLSSQRFVHRDLAARNVLLATGYVCKVADFGLSRGTKSLADHGEESSSEYYRCSGGLFPVKWTPPEAIETSKFSSASDVWSFGIFAVEVFQNGLTPYLGISNPDVIKMVVIGERHKRPRSCPRAVYAIMLRAWDHDASARPNFATLANMFGELQQNKPLHETQDFTRRQSRWIVESVARETSEELFEMQPVGGTRVGQGIVKKHERESESESDRAGATVTGVFGVKIAHSSVACRAHRRACTRFLQSMLES